MGFLSEFKEFAMKGNVLDMAVGIVIGAAFGGIINSLVKDIVEKTGADVLSLSHEALSGAAGEADRGVGVETAISADGADDTDAPADDGRTARQ